MNRTLTSSVLTFLVFTSVIATSACGSDSQKCQSGGWGSGGAAGQGAGGGNAGFGGASSDIEMLDPAQPHFEKSYAEWSIVWWQWVFAQPGTNNPVFDRTGLFCRNGQDLASRVFFLAGNAGGTTERSQCTVPANKALFFPLVNSVDDNATVDPAHVATTDQLQVNANAFLASIVESELTVSVDGQSVSGVARGKIGPSQFTYVLPAHDNFYSATGIPGLSGTVDPSFTVGYWVLLPPLMPGSHDLKFGGHSTGPPDFRVNVTYHLTVE
jgi:hypothetical protein